MHIDISSIKNTLGANLPIEYNLSQEDIDLPDYIKASPIGTVHVKAVLSSAGTCFLVKGSLDVELVLECARCLQDFKYHFHSQLDERFCQRKGLEDEEPYSEKEDNLETRYFTNDRIDLKEAIEDQIIVSLPMRFLCKEDCKGICPKCGQNLNASSCNCRADVVDFRLSTLADFAEGKSDKKKEC